MGGISIAISITLAAFISLVIHTGNYGPNSLPILLSIPLPICYLPRLAPKFSGW
jgi:hypothetical protein